MAIAPKSRPNQRLWRVIAIGAVTGLMLTACYGLWPRRPPPGLPRPVPAGDVEIAWLHHPTAYDTWDYFVRGVKRAAWRGPFPDVMVDDTAAYPQRTTATPELAVERRGGRGRILIRWYKVTDQSPQEYWVRLLMERDPPPVAVIGGWSSDRAAELALALNDHTRPERRPLLLLATATAESITLDNGPAGPREVPLLHLYTPTFRLCFSNRQMAEALCDFILSHPRLRPDAGPAYELLAAGAAAALPLNVCGPLYGPTLNAFALDWQDDPYSLDLSQHLRDIFDRRTRYVWGLPSLQMVRSQIPFSTGSVHRPNMAEREAIEHMLSYMPPPGQRTVLLLPTVTAPARRVLRTLAQEDPGIGQRLTAVTGDGITVNTLFRDRDVAWPPRTIPIPLVLFTHADPFAWDEEAANPPPLGYELPPPPPGEVRSTTEDIEHFRVAMEMILAAAYAGDPPTLSYDPAEWTDQLLCRTPPLFDHTGNRSSGSGEYIVVLWPAAIIPSAGQADDGYLDVYTRPNGSGEWYRRYRRPLEHPRQLTHP